MASMLVRPALGVHVFFPAAGPHGEAACVQLQAMWSAFNDVLGMCEAVTTLGLPHELPKTLTDNPGPGPLAACQGPGPGVEQALIRREHDVFCLTVMLAPEPTGGVGWKQLDEQWAAVAGNSRSDALLGAALLYMALVDGDRDTRLRRVMRQLGVGGGQHDPGHGGGRPNHVPQVASQIAGFNAEAVRAAMPASPDARSGWWSRESTTAQGFVLWEASSPNDSRVERRIALVSARAQEAALDAWAWTRSDAALPPLGRYLLHAAKIRYELRVYAGGQALRQLRHQADERIDGVLNLLGREDEAGGDAAREKVLVAASTELAAVQAGSDGLVNAVTRLREMRRTVQIAAANMAAALGPDAPDPRLADSSHSGPLADDCELAAWFTQQLDDDTVYMKAACERARHVATVTATVIQHRLRQSQEAAHQRQEQFSLLQTAIIGALIIGLTAVMALGYTVPLPGPVKAPVIVGLGAIALLLASIVLRLALQTGREPLAWLSNVAAGFTVAALVWLAVAWISFDAFHVLATKGTTAVLAAIGFVVGTLAAFGISGRGS